MGRKRLYLYDKAGHALERLAVRGRSDAFGVRAALARYLDEASPGEAGPLAGLIGLVEAADGPDDVAENHDHYLYGAAKDGAVKAPLPRERR